MARVLVVTTVYPSSPEINLDELVEKIKSKLPSDYEITRYDKVPIAFGLNALKLYVIIPEESEGGTSKLEEILQSVEGVEEIEVEAVHRISEY
ncbi:elongation factor 1-beta [Hyperthermus butylicus]|uniref:Elongation factor 1-beta n=1 Tax=Hyperthermus butylicus (strain DSM 5456 / JCM 9403 / PLM1-5) TaxID=415426 RepID=EF1B_HYPBU|nr:elongation factor 1-beta [Hyperthermus butylicus]A2BMH3.1 RecName: Full=Elongation factor 1-beta; Short=EF-1-beta; AltName: Full=aEF-1beta [Hyperthermus butylicus DSM 5456]ABM81184.1 elongation factor 1-beta [Hyperthermus butylicus DSM 5456]